MHELYTACRSAADIGLSQFLQSDLQELEAKGTIEWKNDASLGSSDHNYRESYLGLRSEYEKQRLALTVAAAAMKDSRLLDGIRRGQAVEAGRAAVANTVVWLGEALLPRLQQRAAEAYHTHRSRMAKYDGRNGGTAGQSNDDYHGQQKAELNWSRGSYLVAGLIRYTNMHSFFLLFIACSQGQTGWGASGGVTPCATASLGLDRLDVMASRQAAGRRQPEGA